ncbi:MAG: sigma-70 family RNA polymerase sigma factor [Spirochaetales bacterium]|nr:sigma-70 family RNA polymerase sigma factor [Spirochaetales bacterium]
MGINVEEFYTKYGPMVLRRCRSLLRNEEQALDAMQDVFVRILNNRDRLNDSAPSSLLYTTATRVCLNIIRKEKRTVLSDEILQSISASDNPEDKALNRHFLDRLFSREKESTRLIAVMHYLDHFTLEETARHTGMSVSGIRKRLRQLRERSMTLKEV